MPRRRSASASARRRRTSPTRWWRSSSMRSAAAAADRRPGQRRRASRAWRSRWRCRQREVSLVESQRRKCEFLRSGCARRRRSRTRASCARGRRSGARASRAATWWWRRALAPQPVVLEYAAPLLRVGGTLVDWRGRRDPAAEEAAERAAALLGLRRARGAQGDPVRGRDGPPPARVREGATRRRRGSRGGPGSRASDRSGR